MKRNLTFLAALMIILMVLIISPTQLEAGLPVRSSPTSVDFPVVFVGNQVVDLRWTEVTDALSYIIERDGAPIATLGPTAKFYRDGAAPSGTHTYALYYELDTGPVLWGSHTITLGQVAGSLYQGLTWSEGVYNLVSSLTIKPGVTLSVLPEVEVTNTTPAFISFIVQGILVVDGAQISSINRLRFESPNSSVQNSTLIVHDLEFTALADVLLEDNVLGYVDIFVKDSATVLFNRNKFDSDLTIQDQAQVTLYGNVVLDRGILITGSPEVTIADNLLDYINITGANSTAVVAIDNNIFTGIFRINEGDSGATVTVTSNNFAFYAKTIQVTGNSGAQISLNCFHENGTAMSVNSRTAPLDARNNWWGAASGPEHPSNPGGTGGLIDGDSVGVVNFIPWIDDPTNLECGVPDLLLTGFLVQQPIRSNSSQVPLVSQKPAVLRYEARTAGTTHTDVPVRVTGARDGVPLDSVEDTIPVLDFWPTNGYIRLPDSWLTGTLTLEIAVNPDQTIEEVTDVNNTRSYEFEFAPKKPLRIAYVPIHYKPDEGDGTTPNITGIPKMHDFLQKIYPTSHVDYVIWSTLTWPLQMSGHDEENARADLLIGALNLKLAIFNASRPSSEQIDQIVGVVPSGATSFAYSDPPWGDGQGQGRFHQSERF